MPQITAYDLMIPISNVLSASKEDLIFPIMVEMDEKDYTNVLILDNGYLKGIFREKSVLSIAAAEIDVDYRMDTFDRIQPFVSLAQVCLSNYFDYVDPHTDLDKLIKFFSLCSNSTRKDLLIVTQNGNPRDKVMGIITPWDIFESQTPKKL